MSLRGFFRALIRPAEARRSSAHSGDQLADEVRETMGPLAGGSGVGGGRMTGSSVFRHLEGRDRS